ncbi:pectinesterase inhibitor-like [Sesamum indicum]|uniref:Pectinesterase inhibitor-like n=1 Tax=Sesamum indicum TaxID=4182 RepID=A0A6I9UEE3_SESIN|nr:pectinesterase inhibitor-like [Sesamum indicum]XP_011098389.1 pectinesterase inhibitor-like [Sesamum indicum]
MGSLFPGFVLLLLVSLSQAHDVIDDVCSKSENPSLCTSILRSDPQCSGAQIHKLYEIFVKKAVLSTQAALEVAKSYSSGADKAKCDVCAKSYTNAINSLNSCQHLINTNDRASITTLRTRLTTVKTDVAACDNQFGENQPFMLKAASRSCQEVISVLLAISNRM